MEREAFWAASDDGVTAAHVEEEGGVIRILPRAADPMERVGRSAGAAMVVERDREGERNCPDFVVGVPEVKLVSDGPPSPTVVSVSHAGLATGDRTGLGGSAVESIEGLRMLQRRCCR